MTSTAGRETDKRTFQEHLIWVAREERRDECVADDGGHTEMQQDHGEPGPEPLSRPAVAIPDGTVIAGRYQVNSQLERSNDVLSVMATDSSSGRPVVINFVDVDPADADRAIAQLSESAGKIARVGDETVLNTIDVVQGTGRLGLVTPYVDGTNLGTRLRSGPLPFGEAARVGRSIAGSLTMLHNEGIHHGPITPEDIILTPDGATRLTHSVAGSISDLVRVPTTYAAPEQLDTPVSTSATDMYSLGVLLYEMVVGSPPYPNWDERVVAEQKLRDLPPPPSAGATLVPAAFDDLVLRLLDPRDVARPSAAETAAALRRLEIPVLATPPPTVPVPTNIVITEARRSWAPWIATGVVLALLATGLIVWLATRDDASTRPVPAVVGMQSADAIALLRNDGFKVTSTRAPYNGVPVNVVADQSPAAGSELEEKDTVAITISTGPQLTTPATPPIIVNPSPDSTTTTSSSTSTTTTTIPPTSTT